MRSKFGKLLLLLLIGGVLLVVGPMAGKLALFTFTPAKPGSTDKVLIEIRRGEGAAEIAKQLETTGVITNRNDFVWVGRLTRQWKKLKMGEYDVSPAMTPWEVFARIGSGISVNHPVTIREGENMYEIGEELESKKLSTKAAFLQLCRDPKLLKIVGIGSPNGNGGGTLEGYLFPETYFFNRAMSTEDMIRQMLKRFDTVWTPAHDSAAKALGFSRHQLVILASIIEKETGNPSERPMISSVFHNRLKKRMPLQSDPTTIYGMWERYTGNIHKSDLKDPSPFNTYVIPALPVGPISNPGREALEAALHPANSNYLYFVSHNDGTTEFSATLEAHNRAVQTYQINSKGRDGKSWRDLKKNLQAGH